jgi:hypothetical protein
MHTRATLARMGLLDERGLEQLVAAGCPCGAPRLVFRSYVDGRVPLLGGEPVGPPTWIFDGEAFVDGVYEVACAECKRVVFSADVCSRCHAEEGLARALSTGNALPAPNACPKCGAEELRFIAFVPVRVPYEGKRAIDKVRTSFELHDLGFHGARVECADCGVVGEMSGCPLCGAAGPLRTRP